MPRSFFYQLPLEKHREKPPGLVEECFWSLAVCAQFNSNTTAICLCSFSESSPLFLSSFSFSSSSQVGIHHCAGGHLSSDSFVNVNYCSLSGVVSARGEQYLQAALLRRTRNNKPIGLLFSFYLIFSVSDAPGFLLYLLHLSQAHLTLYLISMLFYWS